jgi:hypothetical protein
MFKISNLKEQNLIIVEAQGKITKEDYLINLRPILDQIKDEGKKVKLLFRTDSDFAGYTSGAALEDFKLGIYHFNTVEKCAIVSDINWIKNICNFFRPLIPCPIKIFSNKEFEAAKSWLLADNSSIKCDLDKQKGVVIVEVTSALSADDFKLLAKTVDPFIEQNGELHGVLVHAKEFPYWQNLGAFTSHFSFVKNHHKKVRKIAVAADGMIPDLAPRLASHFIAAEIKKFDYNELEEAKKWVIS